MRRRARYWRQEKSVLLLAALKARLDQITVTALPKRSLSEAITDARNQRAALQVYSTDGRLAIDNHSAERAEKPFAISNRVTTRFSRDTFEPTNGPRQ